MTLKNAQDFKFNYSMSSGRLGKDFFQKYSSIDLAKNLLGKILCRRLNDGTIIKGVIVETEAYLGPEDHASYSFGGRQTEANKPMYMPAGTIFVRFTYGMYHCFNLSSQDYGGAVLIRAAHPVEGLNRMILLQKSYHKPSKTDFKKNSHQLANGPSKLCIAFDIDRLLNKFDITESSAIWIESTDSSVNFEEDIIEATRIGISEKNLWSKKLLRFYLRDNKSVSKFSS